MLRKKGSILKPSTSVKFSVVLTHTHTHNLKNLLLFKIKFFSCTKRVYPQTETAGGAYAVGKRIQLIYLV